MHEQTVSTLSTEKDKKDTEVTVKLCNQISIGPQEITAFFYRNLSEIIEVRFGASYPSFSSKSQAIFVEIDKTIAGMIVFNYNSDLKQTYIVMTAVDKDYRGRGLYKILHSALEKTSKKLGAYEIMSFIHVDNKTTIDAAKKANFKPIYYKMIKALK